MELEPINGEYSVCRIPGLVVTSQKTLIACYECRRGDSSDWAEIDLKIRRSIDKGDTWETVTVIKGEGETLNNPVMIVADERIHFLFCKNYGQIFHSISEDDGKHFSPPREIKEATVGVDFFFNALAIGPGHGIFHQGRLLIPAWFACNREKPRAHHPSVLSILCSEDGGKTWFVTPPLATDGLVDPNESALAVCQSGEVMLSIRSESPERLRAVAFSPNGVDGWTKPRFLPTLPDPVCQGSMISWREFILHSNCESNVKRENLTVKAIDREERITRRILVDAVGGYSDLAVIDDWLFVLYEQGALHGKGGMHFQRFHLKEYFDLED